jgi:hypothetical protein
MTPPEPSERANRWRPFVTYGVLFATTLILLGSLGMLFPQGREFLCREDGPIQDLTVLIFLVGGVISLATIPAARRRRQATGGSWVVAGLCVFGALEELSYGQRIFPNRRFPTVLSVRVDAIHDFLEVGKIALERIGVGRGQLAAVAALLAIALVLLRRYVRALARAFSLTGLRITFIGVALAVGLLAQAMDVFRWSMFLEETLELEAAWAMLFAALAGTTLWTGSEASVRPEPPAASAPGEK